MLIARHLPASIHAPRAAFGHERHQLGVFGTRLVVIQERRRSDCLAVRGVRGDVVDKLSVYIYSSPILQRSKVIRPRLTLHRCYSPAMVL